MIETTATLSDDLVIPFSEEGEGRPVLILHGGGGPFTVASIAAHLAPSMHALLPTHPGWNGVARPSRITSIPDLAGAYLEWLAARDLRDVLVIGSSLGGWIAAELATRDTDGRISSIVLIDAGGIEVPAEPMRDFFSLTPREVSEYSFHNADRFFVDPTTLPPERVAAQKANMQTMAAIAGDPYMHDPALLSKLPGVTIPALVLWGDSDRIFTPGYGRAYASALGNATFEIVPDAGHLPQIEKPTETFAAIDAFLARS